MATMKTLNGYGFNATELNGKTSDNYLKKTDTASDSKKLGGKAPEYYIHPRNLLDNSDFTNPVNQRGNTSVSNDSEYIIDRWIVDSASSGATISLDKSGIKITPTSAYYGGIAQKIEKYDRMKGKRYTIAVLVGGVWYAKQFTMGNQNSGAIICDGLKLYSIDSLHVLIRASAGSGEIVIEKTSLYEGEYTADTLPPYVPKGYAAELAECQRYYYQSWIGSNVKQLDGIIICEAISVSKATNVVFPQTMRSNPTVTLYAPLTGNTGKVADFVTDSEVNATSIYKTEHRFALTSGANGFEAGKHYYLHYSANADLL